MTIVFIMVMSVFSKMFSALRSILYQTKNPFRLLVFLKNYAKFGVIGDSVRLDSSTICQLKCKSCIQTRIDVNIIGKGVLQFDHFQKFLKMNPWIRNIELSSFGEPFLNPEFASILKHAHSKGVRVTIGNGANLNHSNDRDLKALVDTKVRKLLVSIDGVSQDVYEKYRVGGNIKTVIRNIEKINQLKRLDNSKYPILIWQYLRFDHNLHEIREARKIASRLKMKFILRDSIEYARSRKHRKKNLKPCHQLWTEPQINWDGKVLGCCSNKIYSFGDAFSKPLAKIIRHRRYSDARKGLNGIQCRSCYFRS